MDDKNKIPIHLGLDNNRNEKYWGIVQSVTGHIYVPSQL